MPALAGIAAAVTVALALAIYFQTEYRSYRDMIRHGLTAAIGLSLLAFATSTCAMRRSPISPGRTARHQFELQWQQTTERANPLAAEMDRRSSEAIRLAPRKLACQQRFQ